MSSTAQQTSNHAQASSAMTFPHTGKRKGEYITNADISLIVSQRASRENDEARGELYAMIINSRSSLAAAGRRDSQQAPAEASAVPKYSRTGAMATRARHHFAMILISYI